VIKTGYMLAFMLLLAVPARSDLIYVDLPAPRRLFRGDKRDYSNQELRLGF